MTSVQMRRSGWLVALGGLVLVLSACKPIVFDVGTGLKSSTAQWRVAPIEVSGQPGIDIRMRGCNNVTLTADGADPPVAPLTQRLRPWTRVTDSKGKVIVSTLSAFDSVVPKGFRVVDTQDEQDVDRLFVPVAGAIGALTIQAGCTSYAGYGSGGGFTWTFPSCHTSTRSCPAVQGGSGTFVYPLP